MKTKKLNKILSFAFIFSVIFFVFTFFVSNAGSTKQKSSDSALLNPKYKEQISAFSIRKGGEEIFIEKQGNFYLAKKNETTCLADSKLCKTLIENFCRVRKIYKISLNNSKDVEKNIQKNAKSGSVSPKSVQKNIQLDENSAKNQTYSDKNEYDAARIVFYDLNGNLISDVEFNSQNHLLGRIEFSSGEKRYETEDDLSQFLTADFNYWADGELFPEIKNPVKVTYSIFDESKEHKTVGKTGQDVFASVLSASDSDKTFPAVSSGVLSLRHGNLSKKDFSSYPAAIYSSLEIEDGGGRISKVFFKKIENLEHFICSKTVVPSPVDSDEDKSALSSQNVVFELSKWTVDGIEKLF